MMLHVSIDVAGRTLFNHPLEGTTEIVSAYYMVIAAFLPWAWVTRNNGHLMVDLFTLRMRPRTVFWLDLAVKIVTAIYVAAFTWRSFLRALEQTRAGEVWQAGTTHLPVWPTRWALPIGGLFMVLYLVLRVAVDIRDAGRR